MAMPVDRDIDFNPAIQKIMEKLDKFEKDIQELKAKEIGRIAPAPVKKH